MSAPDGDLDPDYVDRPDVSELVARARGAEGPWPALYGFFGVVLLVVSGLCLVNGSTDPEMFVLFTAVSGGSGLYLLVAGSVARGILLARQQDDNPYVP